MESEPEIEVTPTTLGRYEVLAQLASGGMASISLARLQGSGAFQRPVVIKRVLPHLARRRRFRSMFLDEARIVSSLRHPNFGQVYELGQQDRELFLVMEYLDGETLSKVAAAQMKAGMTFDPALAAYVVAMACLGLHAAHEHVDDSGRPLALVHRDVSPQNIFITYDGMVKIIDFGIAKSDNRTSMTATGELKGKFGYMSPEQATAQPTDRRTDIFALGTVLWEVTTGRRLFQRDNELLVFKAIVEDPIKPPSEVVPDYPACLERIVLKALAQRPEDRFATAAEMRQALLSAVHEIAPHRILSDELTWLMQERFAKRIDEKRELLRRVCGGDVISSVSWADEDSSEIEVSGLQTLDLGPALVSESGGRPRSSMPPPPPKRRRGGAMLAAAAFAVLAVTVLAVGGTLVFLRPAPAPAPTVATALPVESPPPAPAETEVSIQIDSSPQGAAVFVDDEARGTTPATITFATTDQESTLRIELDGYETVSQTFAPDVSQRFRIALDAIPAAPAEGDEAVADTEVERAAEPAADDPPRSDGPPRRIRRQRPRRPAGEGTDDGDARDDGFFRFGM